ncbi:MAG TPA: hypothetical protein VD948_00385, partial [Rhodothermales bacterium]|nr:hypothetical protein [Rhodothermales bacterium]
MFWRLFAFLCLVLPAQAQPPDVTWAPLAGPHGGNVQALAALPGVAVASDWERLYRSENGRRWTRV